MYAEEDGKNKSPAWPLQWKIAQLFVQLLSFPVERIFSLRNDRSSSEILISGAHTLLDGAFLPLWQTPSLGGWNSYTRPSASLLVVSSRGNSADNSQVFRSDRRTDFDFENWNIREISALLFAHGDDRGASLSSRLPKLSMWNGWYDRLNHFVRCLVLGRSGNNCSSRFSQFQIHMSQLSMSSC